jgi:adenine-specific DNA-methyltransferase
MPIEKIQPDAPESRSADLLADNLARLRALFPEVVTESRAGGKTRASINIDVLKALVGDTTVTDADEKYGLNWHGKRAARQLALTPSTGTLRPCPEESVDWDTTQNLMIEGDNLEVLKLLQKSYAGKVKLIYIDPPYNTGKDFVYPDNFQDGIRNYLELTGQVEGGRKISSNTDASGRFHTDWLNMVYPRVRLAHTLLRQDGALFVSCDDGEAANLRHVLDQVFGEECFVAQFVWKARQFTDARATTNVSTDHEYILAYARDPDFSLRGVERDETKFSNPDNDPRGPWMSRSLLGLATREQRPNLHYVIEEPGTGRRFPPEPSTGWRYSSDRMQELLQLGRILFPRKDDGRPREKKYRCDMQADFVAFRSVIEGVYTADGTQEIRDCFGADIFTYPKPTELIQRIVEQVAADGDICMDFFAGSGSTANAVVRQNAKDGKSRRFLLVQLPEPLYKTNINQRAAAEFCERLNRPTNVAELTKERLRREGQRIRRSVHPTPVDAGFRVLRLDTSNITAWSPQSADLAKSLLDHLDHVSADRTDDDLLYELLLKLGLDLCVPLQARSIAGKIVQSIGGGVLLACLDRQIAVADAEPLALGIVAWHREQQTAGEVTCVFRDSAFENDVAKTNLAAILEQHGIAKVRSV